MKEVRREKQASFELTGQMRELRNELNGERTQNKKLLRDLEEAWQAKVAAEEEALTLRNSLSASQGEASSLRGLLGETQTKLADMAEGATGVNGRLAQAELELSRSRQENMGLTSQAAADKQTLEELFESRRNQVARIQVLEGVRGERDQLQGELGTAKSQLSIAKSRAGNLLVGTGRVGVGFYMLENLSALPGVGRYFEGLAEKVYNHYYGARSKSR